MEKKIRITWSHGVFFIEPVPEPFEGWLELAYREYYELKKALFGKTVDVDRIEMSADRRSVMVIMREERYTK